MFRIRSELLHLINIEDVHMPLINCKCGTCYFSKHHASCPNKECSLHLESSSASSSASSASTAVQPVPSSVAKLSAGSIPQPDAALSHQAFVPSSNASSSAAAQPEQKSEHTASALTSSSSSGPHRPWQMNHGALPTTSAKVLNLHSASQDFSAMKKKCPLADNSSSSSSSSSKVPATRPWSSPFSLGTANVPGFEGVDERTFEDLRIKLAKEEDSLQKSPRLCDRWSITPLLDAQVGEAVERATAAVMMIRERYQQITQRVAALDNDAREIYRTRLAQRVRYSLYSMSSSAKRTGELGETGRTAVLNGITTVTNIDVLKPHSDNYMKLNQSMAVHDTFTGALPEQFGRPRLKPVALPALNPIEPRAEAMPPQCIEQNLNELNNWVAKNLKTANPIELMSKQYVCDVTIHPCVDANGRSSLLALFPLAGQFELPWPLVTKRGAEVFHCQNGQATPGKTIHPADAMAYIVEGMDRHLLMMEALLNDKPAHYCSAQECQNLAWMEKPCKCDDEVKGWSTQRYCDIHVPKNSMCVRCKEMVQRPTYL